MLFGETIRLAMQALWAHKMRSMLTLLGIIIGVSSVIAVVSFVDGLNNYVAERIFNLGADVFITSKAQLVIMDALHDFFVLVAVGVRQRRLADVVHQPRRERVLGLEIDLR